jgi:hypothetical protein
MPVISPVQQANFELAGRVNDEARRDPNSHYAGKFVGIANGQVVVVADDLDEMVRHLRAIEPNPENTFCLEAGIDYQIAQHIWSVCQCP